MWVKGNDRDQAAAGREIHAIPKAGCQGLKGHTWELNNTKLRELEPKGGKGRH